MSEFAIALNIFLGLVAAVTLIISLQWFSFAYKNFSKIEFRPFFRWVMIGTFFLTCYVIIYTCIEGFIPGIVDASAFKTIAFVFAVLGAISFIKSAMFLYFFSELKGQSKQ